MIAKEKNTRIIALLLALLMILMNIMPVTSLAVNEIYKTDEEKLTTSATPTVTLKANCSSITVADTIYVEVYVTGASIASVAGTLSYDSSIFTDISGKSKFEIGSGLDGSSTYGEWTANSYSTTTKTFIVDESNGNYYTLPASTYLFRLPFVVKTTAATATIKIQNMQIDTTSGVVTIPSATITLPTTTNYTLTVNPGGGTWSSSTSNQTFSLAAGGTKSIADPTRTGYTFNGWTLSDSTSTFNTSTKLFTMGTANVTLTANWIANYTLTVNPNSGAWSGSSTNQTFSIASGGTKSIADPTRTGYTFTGWTLSDSTSTFNTSTKVFTMGTANVTLTANWTANSYVLTVNPGGGTWSGSSTNQTFSLVVGGTKSIADPTRTGYTFTGWTLSDSTSTFTTATKVFTMGTANVTLTANWSTAAYTLTINPNGGIWNGSTTNQTYTLNSGETKTLASPTKTGYTFAGWSSSESTSTVSGAVFTMGTANTTLTANWTAATYTITINPNGGTYNGTTSNTTVNSSYGSTVSIAEATPPTGYTVSFDLKGGIYSGSTTIADKFQTVTFNYWTLSGLGGWTQAKSGTLTVQGDGTLNANYTKGSVALPASPTKAGYTFDGWYTTAGVSAGTGTYLPTANTTLEAKWSEVTYTITYALNSGSIASSAPAAYSASVLPLSIPDPTKTGYTFNNWTVVVSGGTTTTQGPGYSIPVGSAGNITLTANWTANTYQVEYVVNGGTGSIPNSTHTYGTASNLTKNINGTTQLITRAGYTFKGWATVAGSTTAEYVDGQSISTLEPTNNAIKKLYAVWETISYNITYNLDGGAATPANPTTYTAAKLPLVLNTPLKTGYLFTGWTGTNISSLSPTYTIPTGTTGDLTFTANWNPISYTIKFDANGGTGTMTPSTKTIKYDETYTIPTSGYTKTGYILKGWTDTQASTTVKYATTAALTNLTTTDGTTITLYAVWGTNAYNITYTGGGTASPANPITYVVTDLPIALTAPTKTGYTFDGWTGSGIGTMTKTYTIPVGTTGDLTFTANWSPITYYVLYYGSGSTSGSTSSSTHKYDIAQALTANTFAKTGYTFAGWSTVSGGTTVQYTDKQTVVNLSNTDATQIKLYAVWTANGYASYTIQYYKNDGSGTYALADTETQSAVIGTQVTATSKTYTGYAENTSYTGRVVTGIVAADGSLILKRYYDKTDAQYTVQYYKDNGSGTYTLADMETKTGTIGTQVTSPTKSYDGYTENTSYSGRVVTGTVVADGSLILKRYYDKTVTSMKVTFIVNNAASSVTPTSQTVINGQAYGTLPTPTVVDGYEFQGWYAEPTYSIKVDATTIVTSTTDHYLYAKWKKTKVTVTFETSTTESTVTPKTQIVLIGSIYGTLPTPTDRTGYTFEGWYTDTSYSSKIDASTVITSTTDYTVYAKWKAKEYTITYANLYDGINSNPTKYTAADSNIVLTSPVRTGYNFVGWYLDSGLTQNVTTIVTSEQKNLTVYAKWEQQQTTTKAMYYVKNSFENDPNTDQNTFEHFEDAKRYCDQLNLTTPVVVWDANGDIVYDPNQSLYLKSSKYYIGNFGGTHLDEWITGDQYIFKVEESTTLAAFIANLKTNGTIKIYDKNHVEITDTTTLIGTGMQIIDTKGNESITLDIIVRGDVNGDGKCSITDLSTLNKYLTGKSSVTGIYLKAADMDLNAKVSITDLSSMNQLLVSKS